MAVGTASAERLRDMGRTCRAATTASGNCGGDGDGNGAVAPTGEERSHLCLGPCVNLAAHRSLDLSACPSACAAITHRRVAPTCFQAVSAAFRVCPTSKASMHGAQFDCYDEWISTSIPVSRRPVFVCTQCVVIHVTLYAFGLSQRLYITTDRLVSSPQFESSGPNTP